jgi:hypothetical protein
MTSSISDVRVRSIGFVVISGFIVVSFGFGFSTLLHIKIVVIVGTPLPMTILCLPSGKLAG